MTSPEPGNLQPPPGLEDRVVAGLYAAGLLVKPDTSKETSMKAIHLRWAIAATVLVAAAVWAGMRLPQPEATPTQPAVAADTRPAFALMLYEDAGYQAPAAGEQAARVAEYAAWARELAATGNLVDGAELLNQGILLHRDRPRTESVPEGSEGLLAGYFVIRAATLEEAERIAMDCPHLAYGGTVSLRPTGA